MTLSLHWWYVPAFFLALALYFVWRGARADGWLGALHEYAGALIFGLSAVAVCLVYFLARGLS